MRNHRFSVVERSLFLLYIWNLVSDVTPQEVPSIACSTSFRSKTKRATSFCFWHRTRISPTRRTFSCVSCTIVVSSSHASLPNPRARTKRFSLECISIDVTDELHSKLSRARTRTHRVWTKRSQSTGYFFLLGVLPNVSWLPTRPRPRYTPLHVNDATQTHHLLSERAETPRSTNHEASRQQQFSNSLLFL